MGVQIKQRGVYYVSIVKKRGTHMKKQHGGGASQKLKLSALEKHLNLTAKSTADLMLTSYSTYKSWKNDSRRMTGPTLRLIDILVAIKGTSTGREFGIG